jgi:hypothetical protein
VTDRQRALVPSAPSALAERSLRPNPRITRGLALAESLSITPPDVGRVVSVLYEWGANRGDSHYNAVLSSLATWFSLDSLCLQSQGGYLLSGGTVYSLTGEIVTDNETNECMFEWYNDGDDDLLIVGAVAAEHGWLLARYKEWASTDIVVLLADWEFSKTPRSILQIEDNHATFLTPLPTGFLIFFCDGEFRHVTNDGIIRYGRTNTPYEYGVVIGERLFAAQSDQESVIRVFDVNDLVKAADVEWQNTDVMEVEQVAEIQLPGHPLRITTQGELLIILESSSPLSEIYPSPLSERYPIGGDIKDIERGISSMSFRIAAYRDGERVGAFEPRYDNAKLIPFTMSASKDRIAVNAVQLHDDGLRCGLYVLEGGSPDDWRVAF